MMRFPYLGCSKLTRLSIPLLVSCLSLAGCKKDDSGNAEGGGGMSGGGDGDGDGDGSTTRTACDDDSECDDSIFCNGEETCKSGFCAVGKPVDCSDGIECTIDSCNERLQTCESEPPDLDGDGRADASCLDEDGDPLGDDCDDTDALRYPGNSEVCDPDHRDEDCDPRTLGIRDTDNDGYNDALCCNEQEDGELECGEDCDDNKANVNPEATEACDFLDNNCDGEVDEGVFAERYPDTDHDGHGDSSAKKEQTCPKAVGYSDDNVDCDDSDPEVFKGQFEICDGKDNNCDDERLVDEIQQQAPWFPDRDGDTYGDPEASPVYSCYRIKGRVLSQNDCDDSDNTVNPNATEICDAKDNNCNGLADFSVGINDFEDDDGDGVPDEACGGEDCNDRDARTAQGADEVCDHVDNDCDGEVDEQTVQNIWYLDHDGDGWGVSLGNALASCDPLVGRATEFGDCNDDSPDWHPGAVEICDGEDNDCDGEVDEGASAFCQITNALSMCKDGICQILSCQAGYADDPGQPGQDCLGSAPPPNLGPCSFDSDCDNGNLCDGFELCVIGGGGPPGTCQAGTPLNCQPGPSTVEGNVSIENGLDIQKLDGVNLITGDVLIDTTQLTTLVGLEDLKTIGGNLTITDNPNLLYLSGSALSNLENVGGDILIQGNASLARVDLPSLLSARSIRIIQNSALQEIDGYANLVTVQNLVEVSNNPALEKMGGFAELRRIGGNYDGCSEDGDLYCDSCAGGGLHLRGNPQLTDLESFDALERVDGDICVNSVPLEQLGFDELAVVGRTINLFEMGTLQEIQFPKLTTIGLEALFQFAGEVEDVPVKNLSLPELTEVGLTLAIFAGIDLETIDFPKLEEVVQEVVLDISADSLVSMEFPALRVTRNLRMYLYAETGGPTSISFDGLERVTDELYMSVNHPALETVAFPALEQVAFLTSTLSSDALTAVEFPELTDVDYSIDLSAPSSSLVELDFSKLLTVGSSFDVDAPNAQGISMAAISVIGTSDSSGSGTPDNDGPFHLCIDDESGACGILTDLVQSHGYVGSGDLCPNQSCGVIAAQE